MCLAGLYERNRLARIVIDECECIGNSESSNGYSKLFTLKQEFPQCPILAMTSVLRPDLGCVLGLNNPIHVPSLSLYLEVKAKTSRPVDDIATIVRSHSGQSRGVILCLTEERVDSLVESLQNMGIEATSGKEGEILVTTSADGVRQSSLSFVLYETMPKSYKQF